MALIPIKRPDFETGELILINKSLNWTSFDVVKKVRNYFKIKKIGHAGTLDPLATGLLILCTGKLTKSISNIQSMEKEYVAEIMLGATTPSYDRETQITRQKSIPNTLNETQIKSVIDLYIGTIKQKPPIYSAIKKDGKRLYDYARKGIDVEISPREVIIKQIEVISLDIPILKVKITCSKGTYIRSLAHDIGQSLKIGAFLNKLVRTRIGDYKIENAFTVDEYIDQNKR